MPPVQISIVIPSYNHGEFLARTLDSVLSQYGEFELSVRVVDGGSTDETVAILQRCSDPRLSWTRERDAGQVDAINKGLRAATGDVVGWLNSDDLLLPGALGRVASAFARHPSASWLHGRCEIIDVHDRPVRQAISLYKHLRAQRYSFESLLTENYISQMTCFWRRSAQARVGLLDPSLKLAFDYDYWLRLAQLGPPLYLPDKLACFRWYETSKSGSQYTQQFAEDEQVAARYADGRRWLLTRKRASRLTIVGAYRLMGLARGLFAPVKR